MADPIDAATLRAALNRLLSAGGITVGIREITATDAWVLAWRVNGGAEIWVRIVALDVAKILFPLADVGEDP
jgi:hypothetical protein